MAEVFDAEDVHSAEAQQQGWQAILDRFKEHVEFWRWLGVALSSKAHTPSALNVAIAIARWTVVGRVMCRLLCLGPSLCC